MIFRKIKPNDRFTFNNRTVVVEEISSKGVKWYDLRDWWQTQSIKPKYQYTNFFKFVLKASRKIKYK